MSDINLARANSDEEEMLSFWGRHRLSLLLVISVSVAVVLTSVSVVIYSMSGAAQLDLSRPGYRSVSDKVKKDSGVTEYKASGPVNEQSVKEFLELYDEQSAKAKAIEAFNGDPLNPEILQLVNGGLE